MKNYTYKVVGVTFKTDDGKSRQKNIKALFDAEVEEEPQDLDVTFEAYEYEGDPALRVYIDGAEVGNVAAEHVQAVSELSERADGVEAEVALNGYTPDEVRDAKETLRDKRSLIKDGIIDEYDVEAAEELLEDIKDEPIYSATFTFYVKDEDDNKPEEPAPEPLTKKEAKKLAKEEKKRAKAEAKAEKKRVKALVKEVRNKS